MSDTQTQIKSFLLPVLISIVVGLLTVAGGLALYIWDDSRKDSESFRSATGQRLDAMQDTLEQVGKTLAVLTALQERQEREDLGRSP